VVPTTLFDAQLALSLANIEHFRYESRTENQLLADPEDVARRAEKYVKRWSGCRPTASPTFDVVTGAYAGLLIYSIDYYGFDYTFVARLTVKSVADAVASISGDCRQDLGPRRQAIQTRVAHADPIAQAVKLAEIVTTAVKIRRLANPIWLRLQSSWGNHNHYEVAAWTDHAAALLAHMDQKLFANGRLSTTRQKADALITDLYGRTRSRKLARDRKMLRLVERGPEPVGEDSGSLKAFV
jgi:hypothetical protein